MYTSDSTGWASSSDWCQSSNAYRASSVRLSFYCIRYCLKFGKRQKTQVLKKGRTKEAALLPPHQLYITTGKTFKTIKQNKKTGVRTHFHFFLNWSHHDPKVPDYPKVLASVNIHLVFINLYFLDENIVNICLWYFITSPFWIRDSLTFSGQNVELH